MNNVGLSAKVEVAQLLGTAQKLNALDSVWTQYLSAATAIPRVDVKTLRSLVKEMDKLLREIEHDARRLHRSVNSQSAIRGYDGLVRSSVLTAAQRGKLRAMVGKAASAPIFCRVAIGKMGARVPAERRALRSKIVKIARGAFVPGDLSKDFWCKVAAGLVAGGCVTGQPEVAAFGLGFAIGLDC